MNSTHTLFLIFPKALQEWELYTTCFFSPWPFGVCFGRTGRFSYVTQGSYQTHLVERALTQPCDLVHCSYSSFLAVLYNSTHAPTPSQIGPGLGPHITFSCLISFTSLSCPPVRSVSSVSPFAWWHWPLRRVHVSYSAECPSVGVWVLSSLSESQVFRVQSFRTCAVLFCFVLILLLFITV